MTIPINKPWYFRYGIYVRCTFVEYVRFECFQTKHQCHSSNKDLMVYLLLNMYVELPNYCIRADGTLLHDWQYFKLSPAASHSSVDIGELEASYFVLYNWVRLLPSSADICRKNWGFIFCNIIIWHPPQQFTYIDGLSSLQILSFCLPD